MPNTRLNQAIREAYVNAPADVVILNTLEVTHPSFAAPIYLISNFSEVRATLENGNEVLFRPYAFTLTLPEDSDKPSSGLALKIENVTREMVDSIEKVVDSRDPIIVVYRPYLSDDLSTPQYTPPLRMELSGISASSRTIVAKAQFGELGNIKFPNKDYEIDEFPQLVWR